MMNTPFTNGKSNSARAKGQSVASCKDENSALLPSSIMRSQTNFIDSGFGVISEYTVTGIDVVFMDYVLRG
jgi:hypothetical protein